MWSRSAEPAGKRKPPEKALSFAFRFLTAAIIVAIAGGCSEEATEPVFRPPDTTPPNAVGLALGKAHPTSVRITWSAPGDDGRRGTAKAYDIRLATFTINDANWDDATKLSDIPTPSPAGSFQKVEITGLEPGKSYSVALKSVDDAGNWSDLSEVLVFTTPTEDDRPVLSGGRLLNKEGTECCGFVYRVDGQFITDKAKTSIYVIIDGQKNRMAPVYTAAGAITYEFAAFLAQGEHDYQFLLELHDGYTTMLPSDAPELGPSVGGCLPGVPDVVYAPAGTFLMGNEDPASSTTELPVHEVTLTHDFVVDRYEVTNAQVADAFNWAYQHGLIYVDKNKVKTSKTLVGGADTKVLLLLADMENPRDYGIGFARTTGFFPVSGKENWPATHITWYGAALYCNIRSWREHLPPAFDVTSWRCGPGGRVHLAEGWRLLTEAEWEYLARYPDGRRYPTGNTPPAPGVEANVAEALGSIAPVGSFPQGANPLGVMDLSGNVWEWCYDWKAFYPEGPQVDPHGPGYETFGRIARGGSWRVHERDLYCARRFSFNPSTGAGDVGFRCARTVHPSR